MVLLCRFYVLAILFVLYTWLSLVSSDVVNIVDAAVHALTFQAAPYYPSSLSYTVYPHCHHIAVSSHLQYAYYLKSVRMSEDARKARKVLYVANPGSGDSDSEDYRHRPNGHYKKPQQPVYLPSRQQRNTPSQPIILTTNFTSKNPQLQPQLSPDSTGSAAADESTPPPTTPSLHAPSSSVDLQPRADNPSNSLSNPDTKTSTHYGRASPNETTTPHGMASRKFLPTLKAPFGSRPLKTSVDVNAARRPRTVSSFDCIPLHLTLIFLVSIFTNTRPYYLAIIRYISVSCLRK
jgi:hypothetical protein